MDPSPGTLDEMRQVVDAWIRAHADRSSAMRLHSGGGNWSNEVYAHRMYPEPNYGGILISKLAKDGRTSSGPNGWSRVEGRLPKNAAKLVRDWCLEHQADL